MYGGPLECCTIHGLALGLASSYIMSYMQHPPNPTGDRSENTAEALRGGPVCVIPKAYSAQNLWGNPCRFFLQIRSKRVRLIPVRLG